MSPPDEIAGADTDNDAREERDDGPPGLAIPGYPELRAGAFGYGDGALGLYRVADRRAAGDPSVLPDYMTKSWRWNDPEAVNYDLDRKRGQREQVEGMANGAGVIADYAPMPSWASKAIHGAAAFVGNAEGRHIQDQINALQIRQTQLKGQQGV